MDEEMKKQVAVFRIGVILDFLNLNGADYGKREELLQAKSAARYQIPGSWRTRVSKSTIKHWLKLYLEGGRRLEALYPREREDRGHGRAMSPELEQTILRVREEMPLCSIPRLWLELQKRGIVKAAELTMSTLYRLMHQAKKMKPEGPAPVDRRRFEAACPNDLWQSDALHGPMVEHEGRQKKAYLLAIIDDHSRLVPHGQFYYSEGIESYLDCLRQALLKRGLPRKLYVDNGSAFRSRHLEQVTASLGIALSHSEAGVPQGRGKIERYFRTVRENFLAATKSKTLAELNKAYWEWLDTWYHARIHGSTGETPFGRYAAKLECIRSAPKDLEDHFRQLAWRRVERDRAITFQGRLYEAPLSLLGKKVTLLYHAHDHHRIEVRYENKSYGFLRLLDLQVNARAHRERPLRLEKDQPAAPWLPPVVRGGELPLGGGENHE
jgi:putative transposase